MARPKYQVVTVDLSTARVNPEQVPGVALGVAYDGLTVISMPGAANLFLGFGGNGGADMVPIPNAGVTFAFKDVCGNPFQCDEGLFIQNAAAVGFLVLFLSIGGNPAP